MNIFLEDRTGHCGGVCSMTSSKKNQHTQFWFNKPVVRRTCCKSNEPSLRAESLHGCRGSRFTNEIERQGIQTGLLGRAELDGSAQTIKNHLTFLVGDLNAGSSFC